eukprot:scpid82117/ scgid4615/ Uncharacterized protein K02A2.6
MKMGLARSILWWPGLDGDIADAVKACLGCQSVQSEPAAAPVHRWSMPDRAWQRVHVDYLGPLRQTMWLVIVDAHSKWPEVIPMPSTTSLATIASLRTVFARYGCPDLIVSDNGPQFASAEFAEFLASNGIAHRRSAPYHPATNGQAERFVQTFKRAIQAVPQSTPAQIAADRFLMSYRRGVHPATNATPAKLFLGRQLRSRLDLLRPSTAQQNAKTPTEEPAGKARSFEVGGAVLARDYRNANHPGWIPATILEKLGSRTYMIVTSQGAQWKRHLDQLRAGHPSFLVDEPTQSVAAPCLPPAQHPTAAEAPEPEPAAVPQQHEADATDASPTPTLRRSLPIAADTQASVSLGPVESRNNPGHVDHVGTTPHCMLVFLCLNLHLDVYDLCSSPRSMFHFRREDCGVCNHRHCESPEGQTIVSNARPFWKCRMTALGIHPFMHASYLVCLDYLHYLPFTCSIALLCNIQPVAYWTSELRLCFVFNPACCESRTKQSHLEDTR